MPSEWGLVPDEALREDFGDCWPLPALFFGHVPVPDPITLEQIWPVHAWRRVRQSDQFSCRELGREVRF